MKQCRICNKIKPLSDFHLRKDSRDGYRSECKSCYKKKSQEYYINNKDDILKQHKIYHLENREHSLIKQSEYNKLHPKEYNPKLQKFYRSQPHVRERINKKRRVKYKNNSSYKLSSLLRGRFYHAVKNKAVSVLEITGCTIDELKLHLQSTAIANGYTEFDINNYSGNQYHIDHIRPCCSFDLTNIEEQKKCFHFTNLQILSKKHNQVKNGSYTASSE